MKRRDDGYEQMMRVEDPYSTRRTRSRRLRLAEAEYGAVGTGNLGDIVRKHEPTPEPDAV